MKLLLLIPMLAWNFGITASSAKNLEIRGGKLQENLFRLVDKAVDALPFSDLESSGKSFSVKFSRMPQPGSNDAFSVYSSESSHSDLIKEVELRANFNDGSKCQLFNIELRDQLPISKKDFDSHWKSIGSSKGFSSPHDISQGTYVVYKLKNNKIEIRVGFTDPTETKVTRISADNCSKK